MCFRRSVSQLAAYNKRGGPKVWQVRRRFSGLSGIKAKKQPIDEVTNRHPRCSLLMNHEGFIWDAAIIVKKPVCKLRDRTIERLSNRQERPRKTYRRGRSKGDNRIAVMPGLR